MMTNQEEINNSGPRRSISFGRASSGSSSLIRRHSSSFSYVFPHQTADDTESDSVSEAGDIGDRALHGNRLSGSGRSRLSLDHAGENIVVPIQEDTLLQPNGSNANIMHTGSLASPSTLEIAGTISGEAAEKENVGEKEDLWILEYISCLMLLALFGILGVITRYYLEKLFGPEVINATSDSSYMYPDIPSNMVGSFFMGWIGVVFKGAISKVSENLAIGLSTGLLGSLTTFSGWNQKMLDLSVKGHWVFAVLGFLIGLSLAASSISFGIETAKGFKWLMQQSETNLRFSCCTCSWKLDRYKRYFTFTVLLLLILGVVWGFCASREKAKFRSFNGNAELLLACLVGPFGVWTRWYLARLNGRGLGNRGYLKWVPFGTLATNILAASIMAALATVKEAVGTESCNTAVTGIQLGFLGCMSTVSTFIAEFHAMRHSKYPWRAYAYATSTMLVSFALGILIYSVPVWTMGYD